MDLASSNFGLQHLYSTLINRLTSARCGAPTPQAQEATVLPGSTAAHVLVVEDDVINQTVVQSILEYAGYRCTVADNGSAALQLLRHTAFKLVLMDWQMPDMDGLEATRRLRAGHAGELNRTVPVVALTANAFAEDRNACLAAGMDDFVTKPVLASHLESVVERWALGDRVREISPLPLSDLATSVPSDDGTPIYDPSILSRLPMVADGSDPNYAKQLLRQFERSLERTLETIEQSFVARDLKTVQRGVHSLKSSAGQVGALALAAEAARFEAALRRGEPNPALLLLMQRLRTAHLRFAEIVSASELT